MAHSDSGSHMAAGARLQPANVAREAFRDAIALQQFLAIDQNLSTIQYRLTAAHKFIRAYQCFSIEIFALDRWRCCSTSPGENPESAFRPIESKTDRRFRHARHSRPRTLDRNPFRMIGTGALRVMTMLMAFFDHLRR
jgi:hypothetical protein